MPKFSIYAQTVASKYLGEIEAETADEANEKASADDAMLNAMTMSLCHQCSTIDLGDPDFVVEEA